MALVASESVELGDAHSYLLPRNWNASLLHDPLELLNPCIIFQSLRHLNNVINFPKTWDYSLPCLSLPQHLQGAVSQPEVREHEWVNIPKDKSDRSTPPGEMERQLTMTQDFLLLMSALREQIMGHSILNFSIVLCFASWFEHLFKKQVLHV